MEPHRQTLKGMFLQSQWRRRNQDFSEKRVSLFIVVVVVDYEDDNDDEDCDVD